MLIGKKTIGTIAYMGGVMALPEPFVWSWTQMIQYNSEFLENEQERIHYNRATVSYHSFARNSLVDSMQGDWLLMLDTDHQFEPDIALRMLNKMNTYNIDVLAAPYLYKSSPHPPVLYGYDTKKKEKYIIADWDKENNPEIMPIYGAGAGCLMVRKKVFDEILVKTGLLSEKKIDTLELEESLNFIKYYFSHYDKAWLDASPIGKFYISGSMFPEGLRWDGKKFSNPKIGLAYKLNQNYSSKNEIVTLKSSLSNQEIDETELIIEYIKLFQNLKQYITIPHQFSF